MLAAEFVSLVRAGSNPAASMTAGLLAWTLKFWSSSASSAHGHEGRRRDCDALEARILDAEEDEPIDEAQGWLVWARKHVEIMDPLFE